MRNCFLCDDPHCPQAGIDGQWGEDCPGDIPSTVFDTPEEDPDYFDEDDDD